MFVFSLSFPTPQFQLETFTFFSTGHCNHSSCCTPHKLSFNSCRNQTPLTLVALLNRALLFDCLYCDSIDAYWAMDFKKLKLYREQSKNPSLQRTTVNPHFHVSTSFLRTLRSDTAFTRRFRKSRSHCSFYFYFFSDEVIPNTGWNFGGRTAHAESSASSSPFTKRHLDARPSFSPSSKRHCQMSKRERDVTPENISNIFLPAFYA